MTFNRRVALTEGYIPQAHAVILAAFAFVTAPTVVGQLLLRSTPEQA